MSEESEKAKNEIQKCLKKPPLMQKYMHSTYKVPRHYSSIMIVEDDERISVVDAAFQLRVGNHGLFINQTNQKHGVRYDKKGRANARLNVWNKGSYNHKGLSLMKLICDRVSPKNTYLFDDKVIKEIGTKGLYASIIKGNISSITEAMEYHIRYSLRGAGLSTSLGFELYGFYKYMGRFHSIPMIIRASKDPDTLVSTYETLNIALLDDIKNKGEAYSQKALALEESIDWCRPNFNIKELSDRLGKKSRRLEEYLDLWEGGPVLSGRSIRNSKGFKAIPLSKIF